MIKSPPTTHGTPTALELTPLIDIVFIVIVFLLITANVPLLKLPVDIPQTDDALVVSSEQSPALTVTIAKDKPYWRIETQTFSSWADFKSALLMRLRESDVGLTIAADKAAPTEPLLKLLALLNQEKIANTKIIMQQPSNSS